MAGAGSEITVGLPVRNGGAGLARAIESVLAQTHQDLVLLVSDNASTDSTPELCERFAALDDRIRVVRQPRDLGALGNLRFVLQQATTPFFMWVAHDDWLEPDTIERCHAALCRRADASAAVPETILHAPDASTRRARGSAPLEGPAVRRLTRFLARPGDNSRFYGLHRTRALSRSFPADLPDIAAADWIIMALSLLEGPHVRAEGARLHRSAAEPDRYARQRKRRPGTVLQRMLPTGSMTIELMRRLPLSLALAASPSLALLAAHQALWNQWVSVQSPEH